MPPELRYTAGDARHKKNNEGEAGMEDPSQLSMGVFPPWALHPGDCGGALSYKFPPIE